MSSLSRGLPVLLFAVLPLLLGTSLYFFLRPEPSDEDQIRQAILDVAEGARQRDLGGVMAPISRAYRDPDDVQYDQIKAFLFREFQRRGALSVVVGPVAVTAEGASATASFDAALAEGLDLQNFELIPESADAFHFEVSLQKEGEDWKVVSQTHEPIR